MVKRYYTEVGTPGVEQLFSGASAWMHKAGQISQEARDPSIHNLERDWARLVQIQVSGQIRGERGEQGRQYRRPAGSDFRRSA